MCGFVGVNTARSGRPVGEPELAQMLNPISYRGPDDEKYLISRGCAIGFRRLSIVDLSDGQQPIANEAGDIHVTCNGEIYNHKELRRDLVAHGHQFKCQSDAEVIVHGYEQWGDAVLEKLRGIFAFALWDERNQRLLLATDHSGIKPLYLYESANEVFFASEAKAILSRPDVSRRLEFRKDTNIDTPLRLSPFKDIYLLRGGYSAVVNTSGIQYRRYWRYAPGEISRPADAKQLVAEFGQLVHDIVGEQLMGDVPIAAALSGGIDSSAVLAAIARHGRSDVRAYTVEFHHDVTGDAAAAEKVADYLGVQLARVECHFDRISLERLPSIAWLREGQFGLGDLARYDLARAVYRDGAKVLLTGQGIDEVLTGYFRSYGAFLDSFRRDHLTSMQCSGIDVDLCHPELRAELCSGDDASNLENSIAELDNMFLRKSYDSLGGTLLQFEDRCAMGAHVEARVPFLDHRLLEFVSTIPVHLRDELLTQKKILRKSVMSWLPEETVKRPKIPFNAATLPMSRLLLSSVGEKVDLRALLSKEVIEEKGYYSWDACRMAMQQQQYKKLDSVLITHMLDDIFVRRTASDGFPMGAKDPHAVPAAIIGSDRKRADKVAFDDVPRLSLHFAEMVVRSQNSNEMSLQRSNVICISAGGFEVPVSNEAVGFLSTVDGVRSINEIAGSLGIGVAVAQEIWRRLRILGILESEGNLDPISSGIVPPVNM